MSLLKKVFGKDKEDSFNANEYDDEAFSRFNKEERLLLLSHFSKEKKEHDLRSFHDESDALIGSLASFVFSIGLLVISKTFEIPSMLFLATAVFASYFSLVSLLKTGKFKTGAMLFIFPFTMIMTVTLIRYGADINDINNGLSLIALGISLMVIAPQKRKERHQLKLNKLKNDLLLDQDKTIRAQEKNNAVLNDHLKKLEERIDNIIAKQNEEVLEEINAMEREIEKLIESTKSVDSSES